MSEPCRSEAETVKRVLNIIDNFARFCGAENWFIDVVTRLRNSYEVVVRFWLDKYVDLIDLSSRLIDLDELVYNDARARVIECYCDMSRPYELKAVIAIELQK